jgi:predicted ATPase/class 3 adenylate cyclase
MFCDLVGSTALSSVLDPEEMREVIRAYQDAAAAVIAQFEGHIAQYLGDGLLVYFGYPQAHEDDPQRAVRAGLGIAEAIARLDPASRRSDTRLAVRVGIHTGLVVVGEIGVAGNVERLALGETPNLAARLQSLAEPGRVVVSEATYQLTHGAFRWQSFGTQPIKGFAQPQSVWQVEGGAAGGGRSRAAGQSGSPLLIGRAAEMSLLRQRWEQAQRGDGQIVLLNGEPGIGKSRIADTFLAEAQVPSSLALRYACSPYYQNSSLYPFVSHIEEAAAISREDPPEHKLDKLLQWLGDVGDDHQAAPIFAALLSIAVEDRYPPLDLAPLALRRKTMEAIEQKFLRLTSPGPALAVFEDAHWIDPTSGTMLERLVDLLPEQSALLIVTARPEFTAGWMRLSHVTTLTLNQLGRREAADLIAQVSRGRALPQALIEQITERAAGNPLYVEEITKSAIESEAPVAPGQAARHSIPATLRDSLMGRLDRLGRAKEVAQAASVIGREFDDELLSMIVAMPETARRDALRQLTASQLVAERPHPSRAAHYFRHALIQEAAYHSLLNATRRQYHLKIAEALEGRFPNLAESQPETVAHHFAEAGADERAIAYWLRAGRRAAERSANLEAVEHLRKALELIRKLAAGRQRDEQELAVLITLGPALMATQGWNAPEVREVYSEAQRLAEEMGRTAELFPALWGRWLVAHAGGDAPLAVELLRQLVVIARDQGDENLLMQVHHAGGSTMGTAGEIAAALEHVEAGVRLYRFDAHQREALLYGGHDPCVCAQSIGAICALMAGDMRRSRALSEAAYQLAARLAHVPTVAHAEQYRAEMAQMLGNAQEVEARSRRVLELASEKGIAHYIAWANMWLGWVLVVRGERDAGLAKVEEGLVALRATGSQYHIPHRLAVRAQAFLAAGKSAEARGAIDETIEAVQRTGEFWYEPEVYRIKAEIVQSLPQPDVATAIACLDHAIARAHAFGARFWELRAAVALARLLQSQGRGEAAQSRLAAALDGMGRETGLPEMDEARSLLNQLSR